MNISEKPRRTRTADSWTKGGALAGAVVGQREERGGLRLGQDAGGDGGAKVFGSLCGTGLGGKLSLEIRGLSGQASWVNSAP